MVTFDDFSQLDIRIGTIVSAEKVEGLDKLLVLQIDLGDEKRQILAGIAEWYAPEDLVGIQIPILVNLEPRTIRGHESQGMMLAADVDGKPLFLSPTEEVPSGSIVR